MHSVGRGLVLALLLSTIAAACGDSDGGADGGPSATDVWARASASTQNAGAVYMTIQGGDTADRIVAASVAGEIAAMAEIHETTMSDDGAMSMSRISGIEVPAGGSVALEPGGLHVMLMDLAEPLQDGATFTLALVFEDSGTLVVVVEVQDR